jgi:hypothetical protein
VSSVLPSGPYSHAMIQAFRRYRNNFLTFLLQFSQTSFLNNEKNWPFFFIKGTRNLKSVAAYIYVLFIIVLWRELNCVKIPQGEANKSANLWGNLRAKGVCGSNT